MLTKKFSLIGVLFLFLFFILSCGNKNIKEAEKLIIDKKYDEAVEILNAEIQNNPENSRAHFNLGTVFLIKGETTNAKESFDKAISLNNKYLKKTADKYFELGKQSMVNRNVNFASSLLEEAFAFYKKSGTVEKDYSFVIYLLGYLEYLKGDCFKAIEFLKQIENLNPSHKGNLSFLADFNLLTGNVESANQYYKRLYNTVLLVDNWSNVFSSASDIKGEGNFIVKVDEAKIHSITNDKIMGTLSKFDVFPYYKMRDGKLFFMDTKNQVYVTREGWICEKFWRTKLIGKYDRGWGTTITFYDRADETILRMTIDETDVEKIDDIDHKHKAKLNVLRKLPVPQRILENFALNSDFHVTDSYVLNVLNPLLVGNTTINRDSLRLTSSLRDTVRAYDAKRKISYGMSFAKIEYRGLEALEKWISKSDIILGTGDNEVDRRRLNALKEISFLTELQKEKILMGFILKDMTKELVKIALGNFELKQIRISADNRLIETCAIDSSILNFEDNMLIHWQ